MTINSINTNIAAYYAQANISKASSSASSSIARLSSGNRIVHASDDVAAVSAGTSLRTNVTTLKTALINTSQGSSLLQVADGALGQITDILQRQKAIAVQSGSGSLSNAERTFLNQEFQNLTQEVDRLAAQTNFNGVGLLDGGLTKTVKATDVSTAATQATATLSFSSNATNAAGTLILNGQTITLNTAPAAGQVQIGGSIAQTLDNLVTNLNSSTNVALSSATYARNGNSLVITAKAGGVQGQNYIVGDGTWTSLLDAAALSAPDGGVFITAFTTNLGAANVTDSVVNVGAATATAGLKNAGTLSVTKIGGVAPPATVIATFDPGQSLQSIVQEINAGTAVHGITAFIVGHSGAYNIALQDTNADLDNGGTANNGGSITTTVLAGSLNAAGAALASSAAGTSFRVNTSGLGGGGSTGLGAGDTTGIGTIGNNILTSQVQSRSETRIIFPTISAANLATTLVPTSATALQLDIGDPATPNEFTSFYFTSQPKAAAGPTEIALGATLEETLDNAAEAINKYQGFGTANFDLNQLRARRDGDTLVIETVAQGAATHLDVGATAPFANVDVNIVNSPAGVSLTNNGTLNGGVTTGVTTLGATNKDFVGTIGGFAATYTGTTNSVNLSVTVGSYTYTASNVSTAPVAATTVRLSSTTGGGYFDIQMAANNGTAVANQTDGDTFANRLNAAFSTLSFYQNRSVSSYKGVDPIVTDGVVTGALLGTSLKLQGTDFTDVKINDISVKAPAGSSTNGSITFTINGEDYTTASNIGSTLGAYQTYTLTSATDANKFLEFTTGSQTIDFSTAAKATSFEAGLEKAVGVGKGAEALQFQVGTTVSDTLAVSFGGVTTKDLGTTSLDVLTAADAAVASDAVDKAIDVVTSVRAEVGALQSRFNFASANIESSVQNQDAARGVLLDTDIAAESTAFSTAQVQLQAGIAVLAQANLLPQNLLKLIG